MTDCLLPFFNTTLRVGEISQLKPEDHKFVQPPKLDKMLEGVRQTIDPPGQRETEARRVRAIYDDYIHPLVQRCTDAALQSAWDDDACAHYKKSCVCTRYLCHLLPPYPCPLHWPSSHGR